MKQDSNKLPFTAQQIARIAGCSEEMVLRYSVGDRSLPQEVLLQLQEIHQVWQQICAAQNDAPDPFRRASESQVEELRRKLNWDITQANHDANRARWALEKKATDFEAAGPMYAMAQVLCKANSTNTRRNKVLAVLNHNLWRILDTGGPIHQLKIRYRLVLAGYRAEAARQLIRELEWLEKGGQITGQEPGNTGYQIPPGGEDAARLN
ncbi:hypothetical protein [Niabella sp.]|uniref:hypothetical protein n=1 Tax=Niabella sp. TaxID=1962976 RepID=UPI002626F214|nr:hypothetical protein [Niabella sp.]